MINNKKITLFLVIVNIIIFIIISLFIYNKYFLYTIDKMEDDYLYAVNKYKKLIKFNVDSESYINVNDLKKYLRKDLEEDKKEKLSKCTGYYKFNINKVFLKCDKEISDGYNKVYDAKTLIKENKNVINNTKSTNTINDDIGLCKNIINEKIKVLSEYYYNLNNNEIDLKLYDDNYFIINVKKEDKEENTFGTYKIYDNKLIIKRVYNIDKKDCKKDSIDILNDTFDIENDKLKTDRYFGKNTNITISDNIELIRVK